MSGVTDALTAAEVFWAAHDGLPRQAPGSASTTRLLLRLAGPLPPRPRILDIGCGTGTAGLLLAAETGGELVAVDTHQPFLDRLTADAEAAGLADRVRTLNAPMADLPQDLTPPAGGADLIWAEGSAYIMGVDAALEAWRPLLAPGGALVLTDAGWTTPTPSAPAREFWDAGYPAMRDTAGSVAAMAAAGWTVVATYLLPDSDWAGYYDPLAERLEELAGRGADPAALAEVAREIEIRRAYGAEYGYTGYVLRQRAGGGHG
jgi:SAM-dependent methyltransferase